MARSPANGEGSQVEATTLVFPKKSAWDELVEAKVQQRKKSQSASGVFSRIVVRLVEEEHMDRRAAQILLKLELIEEDEDLHVTLHHLFDGIKKRGILKRAMAAEDMFDRMDTSVTEGLKQTPARTARDKKKRGAAGEDLPANVTSIGDAARKVAETAGTA